jgi:hypothetical protein
MLNLLVAKNVESVYFYLCQKTGQNFFDLILKSDCEKSWLTWNIANFNDLSNYVSSGQNGIFDFEENSAKSVVLVRGAENLNLDEKSISYLKSLNPKSNNEVYIYIEPSNIDAATKKNFQKHELNLLEIKEVDAKTKSELAKKYTEIEYFDHTNKLNSNTLKHLSELDLCLNIVDTIDYLVLSESEKWDETLASQIENQPEIFRLSFSKNPKIKDLKDLYVLLQNQETIQLLLTVLFMRLDGKPELKNWLSKLIQVDYLGKTISNPTLWSKLWLYDIIHDV